MRIIVWPLMFVMDLLTFTIAHLISVLMWDKFYANHFWSDGDLFIDLYFRAKENKNRKK